MSFLAREPEKVILECDQCQYRDTWPNFSVGGVVEGLRLLAPGTRIEIKTRCPKCEHLGKVEGIIE